MFFLHSVGGDQRSSAYMVGLIPALVGVALFISALFIMPKTPRA